MSSILLSKSFRDSSSTSATLIGIIKLWPFTALLLAIASCSSHHHRRRGTLMRWRSRSELMTQSFRSATYLFALTSWNLASKSMSKFVSFWVSLPRCWNRPRIGVRPGWSLLRLQIHASSITIWGEAWVFRTTIALRRRWSCRKRILSDWERVSWTIVWLQQAQIDTSRSFSGCSNILSRAPGSTLLYRVKSTRSSSVGTSSVKTLRTSTCLKERARRSQLVRLVAIINKISSNSWASRNQQLSTFHRSNRISLTNSFKRIIIWCSSLQFSLRNWSKSIRRLLSWLKTSLPHSRSRDVLNLQISRRYRCRISWVNCSRRVMRQLRKLKKMR